MFGEIIMKNCPDKELKIGDHYYRYKKPDFIPFSNHQTEKELYIKLPDGDKLIQTEINIMYPDGTFESKIIKSPN